MDYKISISVILFVGLCLSSGSARSGFGEGEQDWGHVDVRSGAHMFYWLYYTTADVPSFYDRPLVIWLQGGPGASSTGYGNFEELGPMTLDQDERDFTWVNEFNVMFIDNPVGSGFSYVDSNDLLTTTNQQIADDLVAFMKEFYQLHPQFIDVDLHIMSESYGGKMAAEFAYSLDKEIKLGNIDCKLKSVGLGDSWISPIDSMISWAPFLWNIGAVDMAGHDRIAMGTKMTQSALDRGDFVNATDLWGYTEYLIMDETKGIDFYNVLFKYTYSQNQEKLKALKSDPMGAMYRTLVKFNAEENRDKLLTDLMNGPVKEALDIPSEVVWGGQSSITFRTLNEDFMKPVTDIVELLLNNTQIEVMVFSGQLDLIVATPGTVMWVDRLKFPEKSTYVKNARIPILHESVVEGYYKTAGRFSMYWVNRAGHMVPADNPNAMNFILRRATTFG